MSRAGQHAYSPARKTEASVMQDQLPGSTNPEANRLKYCMLRDRMKQDCRPRRLPYNEALERAHVDRHRVGRPWQ